MKKYFIILFTVHCSLFTQRVMSQDMTAMLTSGEDKNIVYKDMALGGAFMHSEGWGLFYRRAKINSIYKKWFWELETATMHSDKEIKTQNPNYPDATSYYFGKVNGMQVFRWGTGYYRTLWRKNNESCVEIDAVYSGGLSLAVLKPYYLEIIEPTPYLGINLSTEVYNPYEDFPGSSGNIYGRASVFDGLGQLTFYPGAYARFGFNFDYSNRHDMIKAIETGIEIDGYAEKIPIMAPQLFNNNQFFLNYYLSISFGKRWYFN